MSTSRLTIRNIPIVLLVLALAAGAIYLFIAHPGVFKTVGLWFLGLAGFIYTGFQRLIRFLSGGSLEDVEQKNEEIRQAAERLRSQIDETNQQLEQERVFYEQEIQRLEANLAEQRRALEAATNDMERIRRMNYKAYFDALPAEERRKLQEEMMTGVQVL